MDPVVKSSAKVALGVVVGCDQISCQFDLYNGLGHQTSKSYLNNPYQKTARSSMVPPPDFLWLHWCFTEIGEQATGQSAVWGGSSGRKVPGHSWKRVDRIVHGRATTKSFKILGHFGSERSSLLTYSDYPRIWREDLDSTRVTRGEATAAYRLGISTCSPVARAKPAAKRLTNLQSRQGSWWQFDKGSLVACGNDMQWCLNVRQK